MPAGPQVATLLARHVRALLRQPAYLAISLVQAVVWLPLFGSLFRRVTGIPGFGESSYFSYLTPGVVMMSAFFSAGWAGMAFVQDMERGVMDRLLAAPVSRFSVVGAGLAYQALLTTVQSVVILLLGWALGADYHGVTGPLVLLLTAILLSTVVAALSMALALVLRTEEALIAATNFLALPLAFLSTAMMSRDLLPGWIRRITYGNPLDWAVTAARAVVAGGTDWAQAGWRVGALAAATAVATGLTLRAFRTYQRSL
ncbi:multidrug ABC transporter permease [Parafrankia colletiae]|uniref:Transport permease protein n=1 Tax=Parafrankia colletiae TaxID=573497 RepID=A0A1S1QW96_9ACTN|nr:multidrug ABC transporter permease [Parafrankia colletiae]